MGEDLAFSAWLRRRRKELALTQDELAERVGCSVVMLRKLEAGTARPSQHMAAALAAQRALQAASWPAPLDPLRVRMALHTGPAQVGADGWHAEHTLNRLARLLAAAAGGQVLVSGVTRDLLAGHLPPAVTLR